MLSASSGAAWAETRGALACEEGSSQAGIDGAQAQTGRRGERRKKTNRLPMILYRCESLRMDWSPSLGVATFPAVERRLPSAAIAVRANRQVGLV